MNIDDLLKTVDPKLVAGYEAKNLDGKTLSAVNEEYKTVAQNPWKEFFDQVKFTLFSLLVGVILYSYLLIFTDTPNYIAFTAMVVIIAPASFYFIFPTQWKFVKDNETRSRCEPILRDFKQAVEALNMPLTRMEEYNEISVREILVSLAVLLLRAETSFRQIRMKENIPTCNVISYGETEEAWRKHFEVALSAATKFGLVFNKVDLFRSAKAEITWEDEGCPM